EDCEGGGVLEGETHAWLAAVVLRVAAALAGPEIRVEAREVAARGQLYFDDLRPHVGHHARQDRRGDVVTEVQDADAGEDRRFCRRRHGVPPPYFSSSAFSPACAQSMSCSSVPPPTPMPPITSPSTVIGTP